MGSDSCAACAADVGVLQFAMQSVPVVACSNASISYGQPGILLGFSSDQCQQVYLFRSLSFLVSSAGRKILLHYPFMNTCQMKREELKSVSGFHENVGSSVWYMI